MTIFNELLDELLKGCARPEDQLGEAGLMKELKLRLMERMLGAELTAHLGYEAGAEPPVGQANRRNGGTTKRVTFQDGDLPLQALLMAVWRRKPKTKVHVHSDQGSKFTGYEWQEFLEQHNLTQSMSRRGNCWDNAVAESFFNMLKRERIRRRKYKTREEARLDMFDYIEFFYNPQRKHVRNGMLSPIAFEQQQKLKLQGVYQTRGYSDGKARYLDNIFIERLWRSLKYECVYLHAWETGSQARAVVGRWISFYNHQRPHAAHGGQPPTVVYFNAIETDQQRQEVA